MPKLTFPQRLRPKNSNAFQKHYQARAASNATSESLCHRVIILLLEPGAPLYRVSPTARDPLADKPKHRRSCSKAASQRNKSAKSCPSSSYQVMDILRGHHALSALNVYWGRWLNCWVCAAMHDPGEHWSQDQTSLEYLSKNKVCIAISPGAVLLVLLLFHVGCIEDVLACFCRKQGKDNCAKHVNQGVQVPSIFAIFALLQPQV